MKIIVTGTGRCGTGYIAKVFQSVGVNCGHENVFGLTRKSWEHWDADSSWLAAPFLNLYPHATIIHLVRHPKDVIDSFVRIGFFLYYQNFCDFLLKYLPEIEKYENPAYKAAYHYIEWNRLIEPYANILHKVEDDVKKLLNILKINYKDKNIFADNKYNSRSIASSNVDLYSLPETLKTEIFKVAKKYGYDI